MSLKFAVGAVFTALCSLSAWADQMGPNGDKFYEDAAHYENACRRQEGCKAPFSHRIVYHQDLKRNSLPLETLEALRTIAGIQADAWLETVFEEGYVTLRRTRLDYVLEFYKGKRLIGYKIQYSRKAWMIQNCAYDGSTSSLKNCPDGRISEGSYVSADRETFFSDEERHASFSFSQ